jgi:aminoglycoside 3-N-acetyltransferase
LAIKKKDIIETIKRTGLMNKSVCIHSSYRSFNGVDGGPDTIIGAFMESGCTLIVPTFSFSYMTAPPDDLRPKRNGIDYLNILWPDPAPNCLYSPASEDIDIHEMGAIPKALLETKGRIRGNHPLCSFAAIGPYANEIIKTQQPDDVMAPMRELALFEGFVLLAGAGLNKLTALHLAEQMAGRKMFLRWAKNSDKEPAYAEIGGCSEGFINLEGYINHLDKKDKCGGSPWRVFPVKKLLQQAARVIQLKPEINHCKDENCLRCNDAAAGGPEI